MRIRLKFRIYPTAAQRQFLVKQFGCVRYVYNWALDQREAAICAGTPMHWMESSRLLTLHMDEAPFLREVSSRPIRQALRHLETAYKNFSEGNARRPTHKKKSGHQSAEYTRNAFWLDRSKGTLRVTGIGFLRVLWSQPFTTSPSSITITKDGADRYFVTFALDEPPKPALPATGRQVGIDVGLNHFAITTDGEVIDAQRTYRKAQKRLAHAQRAMMRRVVGSKRREKAKRRVARIHARIGDTRKDFLDKVSTDLVRRYDVIAIEDLCLKGMTRGRFAKSARDAAFGMFRQMLTYKCKWYGRELRMAPRFYPSTNTCSACGGKRLVKLTLDQREWTCAACGAKHDRDINAAKNILAVSRTAVAAGHAVTARGGAVRPGKAKSNQGSPVEARTESPVAKL